MLKGKLHGVIKCYHDGKLLMVAQYQNNMKHGRFKDYRNGKLKETGFFIEGRRCGIVSYPLSMIQKQFYEGKEVYTQVEENGYRYIVKMNGDELLESSSYGITSDMNGVLWYRPEGYSLKKAQGFSCLRYIVYPDPTNSTKKVEMNERMLETKDSMSVFSTVEGIEKCLYMGQYIDSFVDGYPKDGRGIEIFQDFTNNYRISLNATFHNNRIVSKGQFVRDDTQMCICNAEWDDDGIRSFVLFDMNGDVKYHGDFKHWDAPLRVNNLKDLANCFPYYVSNIYISNVSTSLVTVDFSRFVFARLIMIGKNCFMDAQKLICFHMPNLKSLIIGSGSFSKIALDCEEVAYFSSRKIDRTCIIAYCDMLEIVRIGVNCFSSFNQLVLKSDTTNVK